jgi:hypothetical protein
MMLEMVQVHFASSHALLIYISPLWIVSFQSRDIYVSSAWEDGRQEDEEEDVGDC